MSYSYNRLYETQFRGNNVIPATYGNVSVYTTGKADIGSITTTNLAIGKNNTANALDVNGNVVISGNTKTNVLTVGKDLSDPYYSVDVSGNSNFSGQSFEFFKEKNGVLHGFSSYVEPSTPSFFGTYHQQYSLDVDMNQLSSNFIVKAQTPTDLKTYINLNYNQGNVNVEPVLQLYRPIVLEAPSSDLSIVNKAYIDTNTMTNSSNQTITGQKTFSQPFQNQTLTNPFMRDFSNNGFTVPAGAGARITMLGTVGAYNIGYSNWTFVSGASATRTNTVQWWYGSGTTLEWTQTQIVGAPPTANSGAFSGNYALAFTTNAPTQSFYTQMGVVLPAGYYTMTFYSYFGSSPYGGGYIGSTSAFVNISVDKSPDTLNYSDPETRANSAWKLRTFNFQVVGAGFATYIRWTPNETQSALYTFRWAIAGISIRKNNGNFFTDASGTTMVGGNYSFLENPVLNNPIAQNSITCQGTPQFSLKTGASNLVLNSAFNTSNNNVNNVGIGWGLLSNSLMTNNTIVGAYSGGRSTSLNECNIYGYRVSAMNRDTAIGSYIRCNDVSFNYNGWNTVIGSFIGIENSDTRQASTGVAWRCVAIGSEQYTSYNGFGKNPRSPAECISIGYRSQHKSWDNWNVSIGNYSLYNINGNNGEDDGLGYRHYTQYNVALGHEAGTFGNNYSYNTFIGARADASLNDCSFNTAIGYNAKANAFRYCSAFGSGVVNTVADSIRLGRPADTTQIDGSLNVLKGVNITGNLVVSGSTTFTSLPTCSATVSSANQLTNKSYVDAAIAGSVPTGVALTASANTFTAQNIFNGFAPQTDTDPSVANDLTRKSWIDTQLAGKQATGSYAVLGSANTFTQQNVFNSFCPQTSVAPTGTNDLVRKAYVDGTFVNIGSSQTITGAKTFQGGITATATQTITFGTNTITAGAVRVGTTPYGFAGGIVFPQADTNRKLVLYPVNNNGIQNYTIGASNTVGEMIFLVPDNTKSFKFEYGTSATTKSTIMTVINSGSKMYSTLAFNDGTKDNTLIKTADGNSNGGITLFNNAQFNMYSGTTTASAPFFTMDNISGGMSYYGTSANYYNTDWYIKNALGITHGHWSTVSLDLSGCLLQVEQMNVAHANTGGITGGITLSKPFNQYYAVEATGTAFTITLPEITSKEMGKEIVFRKVKQTGTLVSITFAGNGTQKVYGTQLTGANTNALMTSSVYIVRLVALLDATTGGGVYGWFQV